MFAGELSLEEISEKINLFTDVNEITALGYPVEENNLVASFAAFGNNNRSEESHSTGKVMKEHKPAWKKNLAREVLDNSNSSDGDDNADDR